MANILMTGITARGCVSPRVKYDYLTHTVILRQALERLGHTVVAREVEFGEPLREFDLAFVTVAPTQSLSSYHPIGMAWALRQMGTKAIMVYDDWSCERLGKDFGYTLQRGEKYFAWKGLSEAPAGHKKLVHNVLGAIVGERCPWRVLAPMFPWGRHQLLLDINAQLEWWDVSGLVSVPPVIFTPPEGRYARWVSATLSTKEGWLNRLPNTWPVLELGNKRQDQPVLKEAEIVRIYAENWGVLCAPYKNAGSGWWRARYNFAIGVGAILYLDLHDGGIMDDVFTYPVHQIESFSVEELEAVAAAQAEWFKTHIWPADQALARLAAVIQGVA